MVGVALLALSSLDLSVSVDGDRLLDLAFVPALVGGGLLILGLSRLIREVERRGLDVSPAKDESVE